MPQYRKLYVKTVESLDINDMPDDFTRLLWVLLPLGLDAEGRGLDNISWIKARVMPLREDVTPEMIKQAFDWYAERGMINRYEVNERKYFEIPTWHTYQGDTGRETPSTYPGNNSRVTHELLKSKSNRNEYESIYESVYESELELLQSAFINSSGISAHSTSDAEIYEQLSKQGVIPEDITNAVRTLQSKKYTIKGPQSIVTAAINIAKQRIAPKPNKDKSLDEQLAEAGYTAV